MPIKQIKEIHHVKNFINFSCNEKFCDESNKPLDVIIYALNGSGKTTLSRVIACYDNKNKFFDLNKINKLKAIEFDGVLEIPKIDFIDSNADNKILVYNQDFVEEKILAENFSGDKKSIGNLILGSEGQVTDRQKNIENLEKYIQHLRILYMNTGRLIKIELKNIISKNEDELKVKYNWRTFDGFEYEKLSENISKDSDVNRDIDYDYEENLSKIKNIDSTQINYNLNDFSFDYNKLSELMSNEKEFSSNETDIEKHILSISREWIKQGLEKTENLQGKCPFCQQSIENGIIEKYNAFFKSEKANFLKELDKSKNELECIYKTINDNYTKYSILKYKILEYIDLFKIKPLHLELKEEVLNQLKTFFEDIYNKIENKKQNISTKIEINTSLTRVLQDFQNTFDELKDKIGEVNKLKINSEKQQKELKKLILKKRFILMQKNNQNDISYLNILRNRIKNINPILDAIKNQSEELQKIKDINKTKLNFFKTALQHAKITNYNINDDWKLTIQNREVIDTKHSFSEGEKTIIGFFYFLSHILDYIKEYRDLNDLTLVIDDPISSLDNNNFYLISQTIKDINKIFCNFFNEKDCVIKPQLIILTHNFKFYNILTENIYNKYKEEREEREEKLKKQENGQNTKIPDITNISNANIVKKEDIEIKNRINKENSGKHKVKTLQLSNGQLIPCNREHIAEYFVVLKRVYEAINNENDKIIGSDLRYLLETISDFCCCSKDSLIENCECIKTKELIIHNLAHSNFEKAMDDEYYSEVKEIAEWIIYSLINSRFPEQIEFAKKISQEK